MNEKSANSVTSFTDTPNPSYSMFYSAQDTHDKGGGLFAKQDLPMGMLLFEDEPLFTPSSFTKLIFGDIEDMTNFCRCGIFDERSAPGVDWRLAFRDLQNAFPGTGCHEVGVYLTNRVGLNEEETVFRIVSLMNCKL